MCTSGVEGLQPSVALQEIVQAAWFDRTDLSAHGFHKTPDITGWNGQKWQNHPFHYFTYGAAVSEIELDTLTGRTTPTLETHTGSIPGLPLSELIFFFFSFFVSNPKFPSYSNDEVLIIHLVNIFSLNEARINPPELDWALLNSSAGSKVFLSCWEGSEEE